MRTLFSLALGVGATLIQIPTQAQTLFTYGSHPVSKEEFLRVYQKNNTQKKADFSKTALTEYIDLYSKFKMKVSEAEQMKLDTITTLKNELNGYKNQLARNYLTDKEVNKNLANEAYSRMKNDIKASHILIAVRPNEDTAKAYQKIDSIYKAIISNKATFEGMARQFSEDKGSAVNGGNIGYFTALQMVYPFESAAYNTPVGQVSKPFKTQFGYHIVKVTDKRNNRGEVKVAQIMINTPKSKGQEGIDAGQKKIAEIQQKLKSGEKFETLVKEL
jgi:peptidyl-prolyl cis-trans isomerase SurA